MTEEEADKMWAANGNNILAGNADYQEAIAESRQTGKRVAWAYVALVGGLLAFCIGFYYWRFRFLAAIISYIVMLGIAGCGLKVIVRASYKNDHMNAIVKEVKDEYIKSLTAK